MLDQNIARKISFSNRNGSKESLTETYSPQNIMKADEAYKVINPRKNMYITSTKASKPPTLRPSDMHSPTTNSLVSPKRMRDKLLVKNI
jgi:hypothetical protein